MTKLRNPKYAAIRNSFLTVVSFLVIVGLIDTVGLSRLEDQVRNQTVENLQTNLASTHETLKNVWLQGLYEGAETLLADSTIINYTRALLSTSRNHSALVNHPAQQDVRQYFKKNLAQQDALGMFIIAPDYTNLASMRDTNIGTKNLIARSRPERLAKVFRGIPQFVPPIPSDVPLENDEGRLVNNYPTMFYLVPIRNAKKRVIAALAVRLNPFRTFSRIAQTGRFGSTGETYLFDRNGFFLTQTRFVDDVKKVGLLQQGEESILRLKLRDPGVNLIAGEPPVLGQTSQPFTFMANNAIAGKSGGSTRAYRDYRGVPVLGVWQWDDELGIGITTEIDENEALASLDVMKNIVSAVFLTNILVCIAFLYVIGRIRHRSSIEREKFSEELSRSESTLRKAQQIAHLGSWNWDISSGDLAWSDEIYRIFGVEPQQYIASYDAFVKTIHPEDRDKVTNAVTVSVSDPDIPYNIEHRIVLPNGDIRYVHEQGEIERDSSGKALYMVGIVHDITEQKTTNASLEQAFVDLSRNERVLRLALSGAGAGYMHFDIKMGELYWDERSLEIFGITSDEFGGKFEDWSNCVHEEDLPSARAEFEYALGDQEASSFNLEYRIRKRDREISFIHVTGYIDRDNAGQASSVYGLHFDVTEGKYAEQELLSAIESAEMANRAKSEFLAVMSHEIRTPMNAIIGMSNLVMNTELTPRQHNYLKKVVTSAESLLHIINDILDFSKIEPASYTWKKLIFS